MANFTIKGKNIKRLVTRFQYKKNEMCFEILLRLNDTADMVLFLKTTDYGMFRKTFDELMTIRSENRILSVSQTEGGGGSASDLHIGAA